MSADSDLDSDSAENSRPSGVSKIPILVKHAFEQIQLLYHMSILLNRPGLSRRYLRSTNKNKENLTLPHFSEFDYMHICEKLQQWKGELKFIMGEEGKKEIATTAEDIKKRKNAVPSPSDQTELLCRRLAISNTKRRDQLQNWANNPDRPDGADAQSSSHSQDKAKSTATKCQTSNALLLSPQNRIR